MGNEWWLFQQLRLEKGNLRYYIEMRLYIFCEMGIDKRIIMILVVKYSKELLENLLGYLSSNFFDLSNNSMFLNNKL